MIVEHETFCIVVYKNSSDKFDIGHCQIQTKITVTTGLFLFSTTQTVRSYNSTLVQARKLILGIYDYLIILQFMNIVMLDWF